MHGSKFLGEQDLPVSEQIEGRSAVGGEVVAADDGEGGESGERERGAGDEDAGQGLLDCEGGSGVQGGCVGVGEDGGVVEGGECAEGEGFGLAGRTGVVLDTGANGDVFEGEV